VPLVCDSCAKRGAMCAEEVRQYEVRQGNRFESDGGVITQAWLCKGCRDHLTATIRGYIGFDEGQVRHECS